MPLSGKCVKVVICLLIVGIVLGSISSCGGNGGAPVIEDLISELPAVKKGESTRIECITDAGYRNGLSYEWTASGGSILGTGAIVTWTAPDTYGTYSITVTLMDEDGRESSRELSVNVTESG